MRPKKTICKHLYKHYLAIFCCLLCLQLGYLSWTKYNTTGNIRDVTVSTKKSVDLSFPGYNGTHLWSWKLPDHIYSEVANAIPCRIFDYGGPTSIINRCDKSDSNEFSLPSLILAQKWIYEHQNPADCSNKRFAIIHQTASSGFGSSFHQIVWAFGIALSQDRIVVYKSPGNWLYGTCASVNPDCVFLPISHCAVPTTVDGDKVIQVRSDAGHWDPIIQPPVFQNRTFNWYRTQLVFYLMRFNPNTLTQVQNLIAQNLNPPSIHQHRPYVAVYIRRSDKVKSKEMSQAYTLKQYFDLFENDTRRANITTVYLNSEEELVFNEFNEFNKEKQGYYKLIRINATKDVVWGKITGMSVKEREKITIEFLTDLYIEASADLHSGTLTSNWCRLVDEIKLALGKTLPFYTPENKHFNNN